MIAEAEKRGAVVEVLDRASSFIRLIKNGKTEYMMQATRTSADTYIAPLIMENKQITKKILQENEIRVPNGITVQSIEEAERVYDRFVEQDIVVKPNTTNFGIGVTILKRLQSNEMFMRAVGEAFRSDDTVIIESFIPGREYRFLVVGDETVAVLYRIPANVVGDGQRTIEQLVEEKNKDPRRGKGYVTPLEKIQLGAVEKAYLAGQGMTILTVPDKGQTVFLRENSNISMGGDSMDCTDDVLEVYKQIAVKSAQAVGAKICGVDMIIPDIRSRPEQSGYSVVELNFNPALHIHDMPYKGINRRVEKKVLDLLGII